MAESSSPSPAISSGFHAKHDVFLSFRGEDVRNNFISYLHAALRRKGIETFIDYELRRGEEISPALHKAIEESSISIVVFSKNYASSKWCLDELLKILECRRVCRQIVVPVFYHVDPSDVRKQAGTYAEAFTKHEETLKGKKDKMQRWKDALTEAANLSGWDLLDGLESIFIEEITRDILRKLNHLSSTDADGLVGIETRVEHIESSLHVGLADVRILGIWGMGGIGKTTVARALFDKISTQFEGCCFLENIREDSGKHGLLHLQKKLLSVVLEEGNLSMDISLRFFKDRLRQKKVLIVLDDIDDMEQLDHLAGGHNWFGLGSRIIITTRDKKVLNGVDEVYEAEHLIHEEALQLFSHHAFKQSHPPEDYLELSKNATNYAGGIPLALKVLGSCLCSKSKQTWESELAKLERIPKVKIQNVLSVSFDGLDDTEKDILLDIACFFKGEDVDFVRAILDGCGFFPNAGLVVLVDKSLLSIINCKIWMHDLIEDMGKEIVRQEHIKEPGRRSRMWDHEDIFHIFKKNTGTEAVEGIFLDLSKTKEVELGKEAFVKMHRLRLLKFFSRDLVESTKISLPRGLTMLPDNLRYLYWHGYPHKSFPSNFDPENLVGLYLRHSCIRQLWKGPKKFKHLKWIDLSHSKYLSEVPDLSGAQCLENIVLEGCTEISTIHPSISTLSNLISLNLRDCKNLRNLSSSICLKSLRNLILSGCSNLQNFPVISDYMEHLSDLSLGGTAVSNLPSSIENLTGLLYLNLENCKNLGALPGSICNLKRLQRLILSGCINLNNLPENIGNLESLVELNANGSSIKHLPPSIVCLKNIQSLSCHGCKGTKSWTSFFLSLLLPRSSSQSSMGLQLPPLWGLQYLSTLDLGYCNLVEMPSGIDGLSSLFALHISGNNFESLPQSIYNLPKLEVLSLSYCKRLQLLPELPPSLKSLDAHECTSLESVLSNRSLSGKIRPLERQRFRFTHCFKLEKNQFSGIMEAIVQRVHLLAYILLSYCDQGIYPDPLLGVAFPGSQIPGWFSNQTMGDSITLQLPPDCFNDKFVGFALCIVLPLDDNSRQRPFCTVASVCYRFRLTFQDYGEYTWGSNFFDFIYGEESMVFEDHVIFGFASVLGHSIDWPKDYDHVEASFEFDVVDCYGFYSKVKECAVRFIYAQEEEKAQPCFNSTKLSLT